MDTPTTRLTELTPMLRTADLAKTIEFYTSVLGFRCESSWPEGTPTWCSLNRDAATIMFFSDNEHDEAAPRMTGVLYIRTDDVLALHARLKDQVKVLWGPEVFHYGMHEFAIEECNGYTLSFGQPTDAPPTSPE
jgi:catechol 2,3-dioxygenase-like lactoylglutathione lyase family enzyme